MVYPNVKIPLFKDLIVETMFEGGEKGETTLRQSAKFKIMVIYILQGPRG